MGPLFVVSQSIDCSRVASKKRRVALASLICDSGQYATRMCNLGGKAICTLPTAYHTNDFYSQDLSFSTYGL
jgi:hypothetical protein